MSKPSIPQGTRDFSPEVVRKRRYILDTLKGIFELYGFQPLETPAMENLTTLTGKYGEEGDRLIFKILNNGLHALTKASDKERLAAEWAKVTSKAYSSSHVTERALRYDLTIPFARYVVMHQNDLAFPFRRYQMQPVWRADRPQKGRYREFWQCDADVVGSNSLINEAELLCIYESAFSQLGVPYTIKLNSRKILQGIAEVCGQPDKFQDLAIAIDKLDKIPWDSVVSELSSKGFTNENIQTLSFLLSGQHSYSDNGEIIIELRHKLRDSEIGLVGVKELEDVLDYYRTLSPTNGLPHDIYVESRDAIYAAPKSGIVISQSLARGLNYYTGVIVEVVPMVVKMGSIGGGGRYDDLTGLFGLKGMSGVGVSFGIDRIYDVMDELGLFPEQVAEGSRVMIVNFGGDCEAYGLQILKQCRETGIAAEIYPDVAKFDKQMKYANKRAMQYVLLPGEQEMKEGKVAVKNYVTGEQETMTVGAAIDLLKAAY